MKRKAIIEAWPIFLVLAVGFAASLVWLPTAAVVVIGMVLFTIYFFRDPEREIPGDAGIFVSPADGKVSAIEMRVESKFLMRRMKVVSIFLSVVDVHVNRSPIAGRVVHTSAAKGKYLDARNPKSSRLNASRLWVIEGEDCTVAVRQVTGAIARRIVAWSREGDHLARGEKFGMIRFGSRTELFLPEEAEIDVKVGESVRGGSSVIAHLPKSA